MKKTKWMLTDSGKIVERDLNEKGFSDYICQMVFGSVEEGRDFFPKEKAIAEQIVKLPELIEASENLLKQLDKYFGKKGFPVELGEETGKLRSILKKI